MVSASGTAPTVREAGVRSEMVGTGLLAAATVKLNGADDPPPGVGLVTTSGKLPVAVRSELVSKIVIWLELT